MNKQPQISLHLKSQAYILSNLLSYFILVFISLIGFIILFQIFRILDLILINGGEFHKIYLLLKYLITLTIPILLPTSFIISLFLSYKNLREENELIAFASLGLNNSYLLFPSFILCALVTFFCYITNTDTGPKAHIKSSIIENQIKSNFLISGIKPQIYYDYKNFVFYSEKKINNNLFNIFIHDKINNSVTFAKTGFFANNSKKSWIIDLKLSDGFLYSNNVKNGHINKLTFRKYKIQIPLNKNIKNIKRYYANQTNHQIFEYIKKESRNKKNDLNLYFLEIYKRLNLSLVPFIFWLIFISFGFDLHNRTSRQLNFGLGILLGISYWVVYFLFEAIAFSPSNDFLIFIPLGLYTLINIFILKLKKSK